MTKKETMQAIKDTQSSKDAILSTINDLSGSVSCSAQIRLGRLNKMLLRRTRKLLWLNDHLFKGTYSEII